MCVSLCEILDVSNDIYKLYRADLHWSIKHTYIKCKVPIGESRPEVHDLITCSLIYSLQGVHGSFAARRFGTWPPKPSHPDPMTGRGNRQAVITTIYYLSISLFLFIALLYMTNVSITLLHLTGINQVLSATCLTSSRKHTTKRYPRSTLARGGNPVSYLALGHVYKFSYTYVHSPHLVSFHPSV